MTISEAIIQTLNDFPNKPLSTEQIHEHIKEKGYCANLKLGINTVSYTCGNFKRTGKKRVQHVKGKNGAHLYYLLKNKKNIDMKQYIRIEKELNFDERDLHQLVCQYLYEEKKVYSKTIFHEQSNSKESNKNWIHPDMVGIRFLSDEMKDESKLSQKFMKAINLPDTIEISSYELKKCIKSDRDLKDAYFQAVSNSSWANYGYLVALDIEDMDNFYNEEDRNNFNEEMQRLNQAFGIGIISLLPSLDPDDIKIKVLFPAKRRDLDFAMIDKLCNANPNFRDFIEYVTLLMVEDNPSGMINKEKFDKYFVDEEDMAAYDQIVKYCTDFKIPIKSSESEE
jgi:hypothetical protein